MPREPFHRLFFAIRPPRDIIPEIARLRDSFGQTGNVVADDRLHLTTWLFPDTQDFPDDAARCAQAVIAALPLRSFHIAFDRMVGGGGHVLLLPGEELRGFTPFQAQLDHALRAVGLTPRPSWRFAPHMTLLYGRHLVDRRIDTLSWTAHDLVLIDSIVGQRRHDLIARWPLA